MRVEQTLLVVLVLLGGVLGVVVLDVAWPGLGLALPWQVHAAVVAIAASSSSSSQVQATALSPLLLLVLYLWMYWHPSPWSALLLLLLYSWLFHDVTRAAAAVLLAMPCCSRVATMLLSILILLCVITLANYCEQFLLMQVPVMLVELLLFITVLSLCCSM
jgi:hypothetical protein